MSSQQMNRIIERLAERNLNPRGHDLQFTARCPAHDDHNPSLSITGTPTGNVLLYCHAGCSTQAVIDALGITFSDLFPPDPDRNTPTERDGSRYKGEYHYHDADGTLLYRVVRYAYDDGRKTFRQHAHTNGTWAPSLQGTQTVLYNLPQVRRAIEQNRPIWIVEGEKDVETLMFQGKATATCNPGGADNGTGRKFTPTMVNSLDGAELIVVCIDNDEPGEQHGRYLYNTLHTPTRRVIVYRPTHGKDISDHLKNGHTIAELELLDDTNHPTGWANNTVEPIDDLLDPNLNGWDYLDLSIVLDDNYTPPRPELLYRTDDQALLYRGRINSLFGESGSGKSWVALAACAQEITRQHHVIYIDLEDHISGIVERLELLGCTRPELITYFHYLAPFAGADDYDLDRLETSITNLNVTLCVFDSVGEAMALGNTNPNADEEVARWYRTLPRRIANAGPAVLLNDHQPKNTDTGALFAIGSQRKRAAIDGIAYRVLQKTPFARGEKGGRIDLQVAKDRAGTFANKHTAASIHIDSTETSIKLTITKADERSHNDEHVIYQELCNIIHDLHELDDYDSVTIRQIATKAPKGFGSHAKLKPHLEELRDLGYLSYGHGPNKNAWKLIQRFDPDLIGFGDETDEQVPRQPDAGASTRPRQRVITRHDAGATASHPLRGDADATRKPTDTEPIGDNALITDPTRFTH
jgi:hypothetical protein